MRPNGRVGRLGAGHARAGAPVQVVEAAAEGTGLIHDYRMAIAPDINDLVCCHLGPFFWGVGAIVLFTVTMGALAFVASVMRRSGDSSAQITATLAGGG